MPRVSGRDRTAPSEDLPLLPTDPASRRWSLAGNAPAVRTRLEAWTSADFAGRIWRKDPTLWPQASPSDVAGRMGWLRVPEQSASRLTELRDFADEVARDGFEQIVLLGMGGSSLAPDVISRILPHERGLPGLLVLDSTHPEAVRACASRLPLDRTIYLVSSKSGTTLEPNALFRFFWEREARRSGEPGRHFIAITDPGTPLERLAAERHFRACFAAPRDIGGRYSALTVFGLVPAALVGADLAGLLGTARAMVARCAGAPDASMNPALRLGAALGELARAGRDKVVLLTSRSLEPFPAWVEQLLAESLGKLGRGIVPVTGAFHRRELPRGSDVVFVHFSLDGEDGRALERELREREAEGTPVLRFAWASPLDLGGEFFRWELATAACGAVLDIDPFDQPDVERAKELAREAMGGRAPPAPDQASYGTRLDQGATSRLEAWISRARPADYVAVQAFLAPSEAMDAALERLARRLQARLGTVVTVGYGPRFLHSTGQLHKGGPPSGLFLQIVDDPIEDLSIPEVGLTFGAVLRAQARGDREALEEQHRRLLAVDAGQHPLKGLATLTDMVGRRSRSAGTGR